jgi:glycosyltransferase involved in cell wall biosynthesis
MSILASPGVIDEPASGETIPIGYLRVRGWALSQPPVTSVRIRLDGEPIVAARLGMPRPDVADEIDWAEAPLCGFEAHLDLAGWVVPSEANLDAEVTRADGSRYSVPPVAVTFVASPTRADPGPPPPKLATTSSARNRSKVLVFSHDLCRGGAQLRLLDYLRHMAGPGSPDFTVLAQRDGPVREQLKALGVRVRIEEPVGRHSKEAYERDVGGLSTLISDGGYDVVWANTLASFAGVDAALRTGVRSLWFIHEALDPCLFWGPEIGTGDIAPHAYERCLVGLREASTVICVAQAAQRTLARYRSRPIVVLPNSIDVDAIGAYRATKDRLAARRRLGLGEGDRLILSCAPVVPHKGQAILAQAFAQVAAIHPRTVCAMVGDIGHPYAGGIRAFTTRIGLADRLRIEPVVAEIFAWFHAADLFVLPSDDEALASVVLEAMAFGVPVVSTDVAGMPEVVRDGETGILCRPRDVFALTRALDRALAAHPSDLHSITAAALALVTVEHNIAPRAHELRNLLTGGEAALSVRGSEVA